MSSDLELAVDAAGLGTWDWDVANGRLSWNAHASAMFGLGRAERVATWEEFAALVHPEDLPGLAADLDAAVRDGTAFDREFRLFTPDGALRWLHSRGQPLPGPSGRSERFTGVVIDRSELRTIDERTRQLLDTLDEGFFAFDRDWRVVYLNQRSEQALGRSRRELVGRRMHEIFPDSVWGDEQGPFVQAYREATERNTTVTFETTYPADGRWYEVRIHPSADLLWVLFTDITGRRQGEEAQRRAGDELRYRAALLGALLDASLDGIYAVSPDRKVLGFNRRLEEVLGLPEGHLQVGVSSEDVLRGVLDTMAHPDQVIADVQRGRAQPNEPRRLTFERRDGRILEAYNAPIIDEQGVSHGRVWYLRDDTERHQAESERQELLERLRVAQRSQAFLLDASNVLAGASGFEETLERLAAVAVSELGDICLIDIHDDERGLVRMAARHADPDRQALVDRLEREFPPDPSGRHPSVEVMRTGRSRWSAHMSDDFLRSTCRDEEHYRLVKELGFTSYMSVPLVASGRVLGSLTMISAAAIRRFGPADLALAEDLADQVAQVVAKARRYDLEHRIAHLLQSSLLPASLPDVPGLQVAVSYLAGTTGAEVGGDFYDVVALPSGAVGLAVGDVAGHDPAAASIMGQVRSASRALAYEVHRPGELVDRLRRCWGLLGIDRIVTALFARLTLDAGASASIEAFSAGHPAPLLVGRGRAAPVPLAPGSPLGAPDAPGTPWAGRLEPGSALLFYTDGLVENRHNDIGAGIARLADAAAAAWLAAEDPDVLCDRVLDAMAARGERSDDVVLLAVAPG